MDYETLNRSAAELTPYSLDVLYLSYMLTLCATFSIYHIIRWIGAFYSYRAGLSIYSAIWATTIRIEY